MVNHPVDRFMSPSNAPTVRDLDTRIDDLERAFVDFKGRIDTVVALAKWLAGFTAATLVTLLILVGSSLYSAGRLFEKVDQVTRQVDQLTRQVDEVWSDIRQLRTQKNP